MARGRSPSRPTTPSTASASPRRPSARRPCRPPRYGLAGRWRPLGRRARRVRPPAARAHRPDAQASRPLSDWDVRARRYRGRACAVPLRPDRQPEAPASPIAAGPLRSSVAPRRSSRHVHPRRGPPAQVEPHGGHPGAGQRLGAPRGFLRAAGPKPGKLLAQALTSNSQGAPGEGGGSPSRRRRTPYLSECPAGGAARPEALARSCPPPADGLRGGHGSWAALAGGRRAPHGPSPAATFLRHHTSGPATASRPNRKGAPAQCRAGACRYARLAGLAGPSAPAAGV